MFFLLNADDPQLYVTVKPENFIFLSINKQKELIINRQSSFRAVFPALKKNLCVPANFGLKQVRTSVQRSFGGGDGQLAYSAATDWCS